MTDQRGRFVANDYALMHLDLMVDGRQAGMTHAIDYIIRETAEYAAKSVGREYRDSARAGYWHAVYLVLHRAWMDLSKIQKPEGMA